MVFLLSFQTNKRRVSFFSGGDLRSRFHLHVPGSALPRSFPSRHRDGGVCLSRAANTLADSCNTTSVNAMVSEATASSVSVCPYRRMYIPTKWIGWWFIPRSRWHGVPGPIPRCPAERRWKGPGTTHSGYVCRQETQRLETVNSLPIIILHITQAWLA